MQKEPSPTPDRTTVCSCLALRQAARHISQIYDSYLASEGLRTTQYSILAKLNRLGPLSINELAKSMVMGTGRQLETGGAAYTGTDGICLYFLEESAPHVMSSNERMW